MLPKNYKSFGAPVIVLSTDVCWSGTILTVAEVFRMATKDYGWVMGLEGVLFLLQYVCYS